MFTTPKAANSRRAPPTHGVVARTGKCAARPRYTPIVGAAAVVDEEEEDSDDAGFVVDDTEAEEEEALARTSGDDDFNISGDELHQVTSSEEDSDDEDSDDDEDYTAPTRKRRRTTRKRAIHESDDEEQAPTPPPAMAATQAQRDELLAKVTGMKWGVLHHDDVLNELSEAFLNRLYGVHDRRRPLTRILAGPSGHGKTETGNAIAEQLFSVDSVLRVDLSSYQDRLDVSRLIGATPGTEGSSACQGVLTSFVAGLRHRDHFFDGLLVFEEADKAHSNILQQLMEFLDVGKVRDAASGQEYHNSNLLVLLTTNLGSDVLGDPGLRGDAAATAEALHSIEEVITTTICGGHVSVAARLGTPLLYVTFTPEQVHSVVRFFIERVLRDIGEGSGSITDTKTSVDNEAIASIVSTYWVAARGLRSLHPCDSRIRTEYRRQVLADRAPGARVVAQQPTLWRLGGDLHFTKAPN